MLSVAPLDAAPCGVSLCGPLGGTRVSLDGGLSACALALGDSEISMFSCACGLLRLLCLAVVGGGGGRFGGKDFLSCVKVRRRSVVSVQFQPRVTVGHDMKKLLDV